MSYFVQRISVNLELSANRLLRAVIIPTPCRCVVLFSSVFKAGNNFIHTFQVHPISFLLNNIYVFHWIYACLTHAHTHTHFHGLFAAFFLLFCYGIFLFIILTLYTALDLSTNHLYSSEKLSRIRKQQENVWRKECEQCAYRHRKHNLLEKNEEKKLHEREWEDCTHLFVFVFCYMFILSWVWQIS